MHYTQSDRICFKANNCDGGKASRLRQKLQEANELMGFSVEPRLPNSILLASGAVLSKNMKLIETKQIFCLNQIQHSEK